MTSPITPAPSSSNQLQVELEQSTDNVPASSQTFPPEVVLYIVTFLEEKNSLLSAACVSSLFQRESERILYRNVRVPSFQTFRYFLDALENRSWRPTAVRSLIVAPRDVWDHKFFNPPLTVMSHMTNLQKLELRGFFFPSAFEGVRLPPSLKSLIIYPLGRQLPNSLMIRLLSGLTSLQYLSFSWSEEIEPISVENILPNLTGIQSNLDSVLHLVPKRPISRVTIVANITEGLDDHDMVFNTLNQSLSDIKYFGGYFATTSVETLLAMIMQRLPLLETLEVNIKQQYTEEDMPVIDWQKIVITAKRLRSLEVYSLEDDAPEDVLSHSPMDLSCLVGWKKQCPTLDSVTLEESTKANMQVQLVQIIQGIHNHRASSYLIMSIATSSLPPVPPRSDQSQNVLAGLLHEPTDNLPTFPLTIPPEIISHIIALLDKISLLIAARASSLFQQESERILYRDVRLPSFSAFECFLDALEKQSWRPPAVRLLIVVPRRSCQWMYKYTSPLPSVISLMTNLRTLKLKGQFLPSAFEGARLPRALSSLCIFSNLPSSLMVRLLKEQSSLQYLNFIWNQEIPATASTSILPNMTRIKSDMSSVVQLVPNRPVTRVTMVDTITERDQKLVFSALKQSSACIKHLQGCFRTSSVGDLLTRIMQELPQLETLKVEILDEYKLRREVVDWRKVTIGERLQKLELYSESWDSNRQWVYHVLRNGKGSPHR
ncbi:hypothetical protein FRC03_007383 [Tulasnella sp. 419]|nr:hypothetical protein FRC03_007383 [Tulasnella sp. 419]